MATTDKKWEQQNIHIIVQPQRFTHRAPFARDDVQNPVRQARFVTQFNQPQQR